MNSKNVKNLIKAFLFCVILVLLFSRVSRIFSWKDTAGDYLSSMDGFYELDKDLVDVLFLGSSHCYCSVNNAKLWDDYGVSSYSLAISGQDMASSYHCLKEALKTQKPKVVCLEVFCSTLHGYPVEGNLYRNVLPYRYSFHFAQTVNDIVDGKDKLHFLAKWPILHTRYTELKQQDFGEGIPTYIGYHAEFRTESIDWKEQGLTPYEGGEREPVGEAEEYWIREIIELAEKEEIELCFFLAPYAASVKEQKQFAYVRDIAEENGNDFINFIELSRALGLNSNGDFIDWAHTNYWGAQKVTKYLGDYLTKKYELEDHRGNKKYDLWVQNSKVRAHEVQNFDMKSDSTIRHYFNAASNYSDYTFIISTVGNYFSEAVNFGEALESLGIIEDFFEVGGTWVIENGRVIYSMKEEESFWHKELYQGDLAIKAENGEKAIVIDFQEYQKVTDGVNIVVYDNILGQVADAVGFTASDAYGCVR